MSKNNWLRAVNDINRQKFTIPEGWDTREQVAERLQCSPDRVSELLKPGLATGDFERNDFPVWDETRRLTTRVVCYRVAGKADKIVPVDTTSDRVRRALERNPAMEDCRIAKNNKTTVAVVREIRASM